MPDSSEVLGLQPARMLQNKFCARYNEVRPLGLKRFLKMKFSLLDYKIQC